MSSSKKEIAKMLLVGFAVMTALPLAYRLWIMYHPQPERTKPSLAQYLDRMIEDGATRLLQTPLEKWTPEARQAEPQVHAWLAAHEKVILPWEWTVEARRKDPEGYRALWSRLFDEQTRTLKASLSAEQKAGKAIARELWIAETIQAHRTNQIARLRATATTNAFPVTVAYERLEKGLLWGWNRKTEQRTIDRREDLFSDGDSWFAAERKRAREEGRRIAARMAASRSSADRVGVLQSLLSRADSWGRCAASTNAVSSEGAARELLGLIKFSQTDGNVKNHAGGHK